MLAAWTVLAVLTVALVWVSPRWACFAAPMLLPLACPMLVSGAGTISLPFVLGASLVARALLDGAWTGVLLPSGHRIRHAIALWGALLALSTIFTLGDRAALRACMVWLTPFALYIAGSRYLSRPGDRVRAATAIVAGALVQAALGIIQTLTPSDVVLRLVEGPLGSLVFGWYEIDWRRFDQNYNWLRGAHVSAFGTFINAIDFSAYVGLGLMVLAARLLVSPSRRRVGVAVVLLAAIVLSFKRSAWVALAGVATLSLVLSGVRIGRWAAIVLGAGAAVAAVAPPQFYDYVMTIVQPQHSLSRLYTYTQAVSLIGAHPVLGVGLGQYPQYAPSLPASTAEGFIYVPTENSYLTIGTELGLLGLGAFLWLFTRVVRVARIPRGTGGEREALALGVLLCVVWFLLQSATADLISAAVLGVLFLALAVVEQELVQRTATAPEASVGASAAVSP